MISVIQATKDHIEQLTEAFEAYRVFYRKEPSEDASRDFLSERISKNESVIYIALSEKKEILGFTQLYPSFSSTRLKRAWILNDLFVHKHSRGQGISKALINKAKELTRSTNSCVLMLETEKDNVIGNSLYKATDFKLETNNFYYWTP